MRFPLASTIILSSSEWQIIICIAAALWLLFEVWKGWQLGFFRGLLKFIALIVAWFAGSAIVATLSTLFIFLFHTSSSLISSVVGVMAGVIIYFLVSFLSALLFKKTNHYHGFFRALFGIGGACWGLLFGLFFLWGTISVIRSLGLVGEMRLLKAQQQGLSTVSDPLACNLVRIKKSLELGPLGVWFVQVDPLTSAFYENTKKSIMLLQDHKAFMRFMNAPKTQQLLAHPLMKKMLYDPQVQQAISSGNLFLLVENKNVQQALSDPILWQQLKSFDLSAVLNQACKQDKDSINDHY
ncbi:MAG: CvpA family protein [Chthoniobacterales bacterium]|nr:CvpA family protein [Chthoniobacterales bacterium]